MVQMNVSLMEYMCTESLMEYMCTCVQGGRERRETEVEQFTGGLIKMNPEDVKSCEESTDLTYTGLFGELEHLKIETRLINEKFASVMGECVIQM